MTSWLLAAAAYWGTRGCGPALSIFRVTAGSGRRRIRRGPSGSRADFSHVGPGGGGNALVMCVAAPAHAAAGGETSGGETAEIEPNAKESLGTPADAHGGRVSSVGSGPPHVLGLGICPHTCPNFAEFRVP